MTRVAVVGHFLSSNIGDRYQGTGVADRVAAAMPSVTVDRINSHPFTEDAVITSLSNMTATTFDVLNPTHVDFGSYEYAIVTSGSLAADSRFVALSLEFLSSSRLKRLFVWGGFHDITDFASLNEPSTPLKTVLCDPRTSFFARGWLELTVFQMIAGGDRGRCGGDPVLANDFSAYRRLVGESKRKPTLIVSGHVYEHSGDAEVASLRDVVSTFPTVCSVEAVQDAKLMSQLGLPMSRIANTLADYAAIAASASVLVTQRLHGLALAKVASPSLPVIVWVPKKEKFSHIKFRSVAESAAGFRLGIAHFREELTSDELLRASSAPDSYLSREHENNFSRYMTLTEQTLRTIIAQMGD